MLFQGQEFAASTPFLYFADNAPEDAEAVAKGRREFLSQFPSIAAGGHVWLTDPASSATFQRSKLDLTERESHAHAVALHRDFLELRRKDRVFAAQLDGALGAVLADETFALRYFGVGGDDRLVIVNFGRDLTFSPCPEPLLAPPQSAEWKLIWSSEDAAYGGEGTPPHDAERWHLPGHATLVFAAERGAWPMPALPGQPGASPDA
jgi:maltooligosyltrehalose trehalohydrolase